MKYKLYSICLVVILVLSVNNIYAEEPVQNTQTQQNVQNQVPVQNENMDIAVNVLTGLKMVNGKEDGQFHPEQNITREEYVKLIIEFLDISDEISLAKEQTTFEDVEPSRWSSKYIDLAVDIGIIKGYDNGLFKPSENITLEQGVTILLRGMGYKDEYLGGKWPLNYIMKATQEGILNGVDNTPNSLLTRGNSALMIYNALDAKYIDGIHGNQKLSNKSFIEGKLKLYKLNDMRVVEKSYVDDEKVVKFEFTKSTKYKENRFKSKEQKSFSIKDSININLNEGMDYILYVDSRERVVYAYEHLKNKNSYKIQSIENSYDERPVEKIKLSSEDEYISIGRNSKIYVNGEKVNEDKYEDYLKNGVIGSFIVEDETLTYANITLCEYSNFLIQELNLEKQSIKGIFTEDGYEDEISFKKFDNKYKIHLIEGNNIRDIQFNQLTKDYMISISNEIGDNDERIIYAWKNNIVGSFQKVFGGINQQKLYFTIQNNQDKYYLTDNFSYRYNKNKDINVTENKTNYSKSILEEFYNQQVSIYRDLKGDVIYIEGNFNSNNGLYGVLMKYGDELRGEIQIFTRTGSKTVYAFDDPDEYLRLKERAKPGCILKYSINKSNKLKNLSNNLSNDVFDKNDLATISAGDDFGEDFTIIDGEKMYVDSNTIYFDYTDNNPNNVKKITWNRLKDKHVISDVKVVYIEKDNKIELLAIRENFEGIKEETLSGYIHSTYTLGNNRYISVENNLGEIKDYQLDDVSKNMFLDQRVVIYKINTNNKVEIVNDDKFKFVVGIIEDTSKKSININDEWYVFSTEDKIYNGLGEKLDFYDLEEGDIVVFYSKGNRIKTAKWLKYDKYSTIGEGVIEDIDVGGGEISIDMDGEIKTFYCVGETDYIMSNGYLETNRKDNLLIEEFRKRIGSSNRNVKFIYNKETEDIYLIIVEE